MPKPPSPICSNKIYGPITVPGSATATGSETVEAKPGPARLTDRQGCRAQKKGVQMLAKDGVASAGPLKKSIALAHRTLQRLVKDRFLAHMAPF